jgi:hypothetical protein
MTDNLRNLLTPISTAAWCHLIEAREQLTPGKFAWELALELTDKELGIFTDMVEIGLAQHRMDNPLFPKSDERLQLPWDHSRASKNPDGSKGEIIQGKWILKMKKMRDGVRKGAPFKNKPPFIQDSQGFVLRPGQDIDEIPYGSKMRACFDFFFYNKAGNYGAGAALNGVQLIELAQSEYRFDASEGGGYTCAAAQDETTEELPF